MIPRRWRLLLKFVGAAGSLPGIPAAAPCARFVVLARQRSGSTWLIDLLDSHPQITTFSEIFQYDAYGKLDWKGNEEILTWQSYRGLHPPGPGRLALLQLYFRYLDEEIFTDRGDATTVGIKLMYNQAVSAFAILAYLKVRRVSVVHLIRRNHLDAVLSEEGRNLRSVAHAQVGVDVASVKIDLDTHSLLNRLEERELAVREAQAEFSRLSIPYCEVVYEDLLEDNSRVNNVLRFLKLEPVTAGLTSNLQKLNRADHRELLANYEQVRARLAGTKYADLLR